MKPDDHQDTELRDAMGTLRREDERRAPPFETMWQRAQKPRKPARAVAAKALVVVGPLAAAAGLALWIALGTSNDVAPSASSPVSVAASAAPVAAVSAPTQVAPAAIFPSLELDFLLREPRVSALAGLPDFDIDPVSRRPLP